MNVDFWRAFKLPFEEPRGLSKLIIGGFILFVAGIFMNNWSQIIKLDKDFEYIFYIINIIGAILNLTVIGYVAQSAYNEINSEDLTMPEWNDFTGFLWNGLKFTLVSLLYSLPFIALIGGGIFWIIMQPVNMWFIIPVLVLIYLILAVSTPVMLMLFFKNLKFSVIFNLIKIFKITSKNILNLLILLIMTFGIGLLTVLTAILCTITCVGIILLPAVSVLNMLAMCNLTAQAGKDILWEANEWTSQEI